MDIERRSNKLLIDYGVSRVTQAISEIIATIADGHIKEKSAKIVEREKERQTQILSNWDKIVRGE